MGKARGIDRMVTTGQSLNNHIFGANHRAVGP